MKKLIIVSTRPGSGKGGISTALEGYIAGLNEHCVSFDYVESHWAGKNMIVCWLMAFFKVSKLAFKYRNNAVFWFHLGPWFSSFRKFSLALIPRLVGAKTIGHVHSPAVKDYLDRGGISRWSYKLLLLPYSNIVALTPWWKTFLSEYLPNKHIVICPNPNNRQDSATAKEYLERSPDFIDKESTSILTMARLVKGKNVEKVIDALALLPKKYSLTIAGEGDLEPQLKQQVENLGLSDRVRFTGWISGADKTVLLKEADIFCLPSSYDSFGMVFIEAMANNVPVVALGWGPIKDVVLPSTGELVNRPEPRELVQAIEKVRQSLDTYHLEGPKYVYEKYQSSIVIKTIINFL